MASYRPKIKLNASGETRDLPLDAETLKGKTLDYFASKSENDQKANRIGDVITTMNEQYFIANNKFGINMGNSDIVGINSLVFADPLDSPDEGILFPKIYNPGNLLKNYNLFKVDGVGQPFVNENKIYHQGFKPTKTDVGLGNVDNTSDANKPISTATQNALNGKMDNGIIQCYYGQEVSFKTEGNQNHVIFNWRSEQSAPIERFEFYGGKANGSKADIVCRNINCYNIDAGQKLLFNGDEATIALKNSLAEYPLITFKANTSDNFGHGILIGGGGSVVIGAGESASVVYSNPIIPNAGDENLRLASDENIYFYTNQQAGFVDRGTYINAEGHYIMNNKKVATITELNKKIDKPTDGKKYGMYRHSCSVSTTDGTFYFEFWCDSNTKLDLPSKWQSVKFWGGSGAISNTGSIENGQQTSVFKKGTQLFYYTTSQENLLIARYINTNNVNTYSVYDFFGNKIA